MMNKVPAHSLRARRGGHSLFRATAVQFPAATPVGLAALRLKQRTGKLAVAFAIALLFAGITMSKAAEPETSREVKMDAAQSAIVTDAIDAAQWMAKRLSDTGYKGDFTLESLKDVDRFFDEQAPHGKPKAGGHLSHHFGMQIFALGAYVGETIRRKGEGQWVGDDRAEHPEITLAVRLKSGVEFWPTQRVMKRFQNGPEDGVYAYAFAILGD
jgi:hypothetical protein